MKIVVEVIQHDQHRKKPNGELYDTCGDWQWDNEGADEFSVLKIHVSDTGDWRMNFLIARHEMDEAMLCRRRGVSEQAVDDYDFTHPNAGGDDFSEDTEAPYYLSHCDALASEWQMAHLLGVDWVNYGKALEWVA